MSGQAAVYPLSKGRYIALTIAMVSAFFVYSLSMNSYAVIASGVTEELSLSASQSGLLMSASIFTFGVAVIPLGMITSSFPRKWLLFIVVAVIGFGCLSFAVLDSYYGLLAARGLIGLASAGVLPIAIRIQAEIVPPEKRQQSTGITGMGWGAGLLGTFFGLSFIFSSAGWRPTMVAVALTAAVSMALILFSMRGMREAIEPPSKWSGDEVRSIVMSRGINCLMLINFGLSCVSSAAIQWVPAHISENLGSTVLMANIMMGAFSLGQFVSSSIGGSVSVRLGRRLVLVSSTVVSMVSPILIALAPSEASVIVIMAVLGWFTMLQFGPVFSSVPRFVSGRVIPVAASYISAIGFGLSLITPWLFGLILDVSGVYLYAFGMLSVFGIAGVIGAILVPVESKAERLSGSSSHVVK